MKSSPLDNFICFFESEFRPLGQAKVGVLTHALHYGTGVFEGIRAYWDEKDNELYVFRLREHMERWKRNARLLRIELPLTVNELCDLTVELIRKNSFRETVYIRPLAFKSAERIGIRFGPESEYTLVAIPFGDYLDSHAGLHVCVSSWRRVEDNAIPGRGKICGCYVNSALAEDEAHLNGFDEAIFLNENGHVAEGAACNIFLVRDGKLITPATSENILEGITRDSIMQLAREEVGVETVERIIDRSELYQCEEMFFTGTAVEVAPITRVDHREVGDGTIGPIARRLRQLYHDAVHCKMKKYEHWCLPVYKRKAMLTEMARPAA